MKNCQFRSVLRFAMVAAVLLAAAPVAAQQYDRTDLGTLGGSFSAAYGVSDDGTKIVGESATAGGTFHAFLWEGGVMTDLGTLGGPISAARDVNNAGVVVGYSLTSQGLTRAFVCENGVMTDLGTLGGNSAAANAINDQDHIVGSAQVSPGVFHAVRWERQGGGWVAIDLGTLGGNNAEATDINESGTVVGGSLNPGGQLRAFIHDGSGMTDLGTLGGEESSAFGINDSDDVVGFAENSSGQSRPAMWNGGAGPASSLPTFGGAGGSGQAITNTGIVVGEADNMSLPIAAIWEGGSIDNLGSLKGPTSVANGASQTGRFVGLSGSVACYWEEGAPLLTVTDLGTLGGSSSEAFAINDASQVTGVSRDANENFRAFIWENGVMTDIGDLGGIAAIGNDINNDGHIVGLASNAKGDPRAFFWNGSTMMDLGTLGGLTSTALAINDDGIIVGQADTASFDSHAFIYENGQMTQLPTFTGSFSSLAADVDSSGDLVVGWAFNEDFDQRPVRWVRNQSGGWNIFDLGTLGGDGGEATAVDDNGIIVGEAQKANGRFHAFAWIEGGGLMNDLGVLHQNSKANDIHSLDLIVGEGNTNIGGTHAVIFSHTDGTARDLNDRIDKNTGWRLRRANAVNQSMVAVGFGELNGAGRAFLINLVPPAGGATLTGFTRIFGTHISGNLASVQSSDNSFLVFNSQFGFSALEPNIIDVVFHANTQNTGASSIGLLVESRLNNPGGRATMRLRNWSNNQFDTIHTYTIGTAEIVETANGAAANHIDAGGDIDFSYKLSVIATFAASGFRVEIDEVDVSAN